MLKFAEPKSTSSVNQAEAHHAPSKPELVNEITEITEIEIIAVNLSIRDLAELRADYGGDRWHKLKGKAYIQRQDGRIVWAAVHWYECHSVGRRRTKVKKELE